MRHVLLYILLLSSISFAHAKQEGEDDYSKAPFRISVQSPSYGFCRPGYPVTAIVSVTNATARQTGVVEAWIGDRRTACISRQAFSIGKGRFRFTLYPVTQDSEPGRLNVVARDSDGRLLESTWLPLKPLESKWWIAAIGVKNRQFSRDSLVAIKPAVLPIRKTEALPDLWCGYRMFDALFWDGQQGAKLSGAQQTAMTDWIMAGGRLVIMAKKGDSSIRSPIPKVFPHVRQLPAVGLLSDSGISTLFSSMGFKRQPNSSFSEKPLGLGSIVLLHCDYAELATWTQQEAFPLMGYPSTFSASLPRFADEDYSHDATRTITSLRSKLSIAAGYQSISFTPILVLMVSYIIFVAVLDLLVLRKLRKLPYTWVTFPILIGIFSAISFVMFYRGNTGDDMRYELRFQDVAPDGNGRVCAVTCIRKPSRKPFRFNVPDSHYLVPIGMEYSDMSRYQYGYNEDADQNRRTLIVGTRALDGSTDIAVPGHMGAFKFFTEEWAETEEEPPFTCSFRATKEGLRGTYTQSESIPDSVSGFVVFRGALQTLNPAKMSVTSDARSIFLKSTGHNQYMYYRSRTQEPNYDMKDSLQSWTKEALDTIGMTSIMYYSGTIASVWHQDEVIFRHSRDDNKAILYAFYEEKSKTTPLPFRRIKCVRQIVRVNDEGSL